MTTATDSDRIASLGVGVVTLWADGRLEMNPAGMRMLGISAVPASLEELRILLDARDSSGERRPLEDTPMLRALQGESHEGEFIVTHQLTGERLVTEIVATPVRDGSGTIVAGQMTTLDITARRKAEREKDEFLSIVSHELKTPLTPLKAISQLLRGRLRRTRTEGKELDLDALDRNLATIDRQVTRMNGLVNDLLDVSRAGRATFELQPEECDLAIIVNDVGQRYVEATTEEGRHTVVISAPESLQLVADQVRMEQALWNIVGNAVKYSPRGGQVGIQLRAEGTDAVIVVTDEGIGIPREELPLLGREAFSRGTGPAASFAGMGIGLYLSRLVCERHGGSLEIDSPGEGLGSTVTMRIPIAGP